MSALDSNAVAELRNDRPDPAIPYVSAAREAIFDTFMRVGYWPENGRAKLDVDSYISTLTASDCREFLMNLWTGGEAASFIKGCHEPTIRHWIEYDCAAEVLDLAADMAREAEEDAENLAWLERHECDGVMS